MAPNPRFINAYNAMRTLGISDDEVKPVLKNLLKMYDKRWELIEEDNYQILVDAYFEAKEDKQAEGGKRKAPISYHDGERATQKLHLVDGDDQGSSTGNSVQLLSVENTEMLPKTSMKKIIKPSHKSTGDLKPKTSSQALQTRLSETEIISNLPGIDARGRKSYPEKAESSGHCKGPIDESSCPQIERKHMPSDHYQKELMEPKTKKLKLHLGPVSSRFNGPCDALNEHRRFKSLKAVYRDTEKKDDTLASNRNTRICEGNIDIASSPSGEIKISLNCDAALGQPNFRVPNLDVVMKSMEEKYLRSRKTAGPQLSMVKLLDDLCESYLKLGMNSNRKGSNPSHANSHMAYMPQQAIAQDENNPVHFLSDITKGSENVKISLLDETKSEDLPKFNYVPYNLIYQSANVNISLARIADEGCCSDCSGDCLSLPFPCACAQETGGEFAYTPQGLLKEEFLTVCMSMTMEPQDHHFVYCQECPLERSKNENMHEQCKGHLVRKFIKECWRKCGCDLQCGNRVVQRGLRCKLQVFFTPQGKGWGLRTLEDLPKGCFVCEYVGEILTNTELYERTLQNSGKDRHTYPVTLDADWGSEGVLKDEEALCLDATYNGNVARFINHRCLDANLIDIPVEVETPDRHYYHIALFTNRKVKAYEELTWDYGIDFDDHDHPIKAFQCCCGSALCRDKKQKGTRLLTKKNR